MPDAVGIFIEGEARGGWEAGNETNDNDDGLFSVLVLGRMKDEFADFDLEPKMRERRRRRSTIALFLLPPQLQYSKEVPKQLDDHSFCNINVSGSLLLHANDNTSSCLLINVVTLQRFPLVFST